MKFKGEFSSLFKFGIVVALFIISRVIGSFVVSNFFTLPLEGRLSNEVPIGLLVLPSVLVSIAMILKLFRSQNFFRNRITFITLGLILFYSIVILGVSSEHPDSITFNTRILFILTDSMCFIAMIIFLGWVPKVRFSREKPWLDSIYFATSIMWLSPFLAELYIWAKWYVTGIFWEKASYMTLGGAGTKDILFWFGFLTFITMSSFQVLILFFKKMQWIS